MYRAYIGLGANLGDPSAQLREALRRMADLGTLAAVSPFYRSPPMGPQDQPAFCNAVAVLDTPLAAPVLMQALLGIEQAMGRVRAVKWGPRRIDLDLLHVEGEVCDTPGLRLPHPGLGARDFVLQPLQDVAPALRIPGLPPLSVLMTRLGAAPLRPWDEG